MKEAIAVTGYIPDYVAKQLAAKQPGPIDVKPERGIPEIVMRVDGADVDEVRTGSSAQGETLVQLILRPDTDVQIVTHGVANVAGLARLNDPILARLVLGVGPKTIAI